VEEEKEEQQEKAEPKDEEKEAEPLCWAVFDDRGRQHKVKKGDTVCIDYRDDVEDGGKVEFKSVLLVRDGERVVVGKPTVEGASVVGHIVRSEVKDRKIEVLRYKRRKRYRRKKGHRQRYTEVMIDEIRLK